jgi:hypothetical protein
MNVSGVGATPPPHPLPPVAPAAGATEPAPSNRQRSGENPAGQPRRPVQRPAHDAAREAEPPAAPPMRVLTVTEMRIMLGQLPVSAGLKPQHQSGGPAAA